MRGVVGSSSTGPWLWLTTALSRASSSSKRQGVVREGGREGREGREGASKGEGERKGERGREERREGGRKEESEVGRYIGGIWR